MLTVFIAETEEKVKEIIAQTLSKLKDTNINISKQGDMIKILEKENLRDLVTLKEKLIELEDTLYNEKKGQLYKAVLECVEKPLLEHILERADGNQLKAARILGLNRNTIRAKIKKLGINTEVYKL